MIKKIFAMLLVLTMLLSFTSCGISESVVAAEEAIENIGEVSLDSGEAIKNAEKLYNDLTDKEKEKLSNRMILIEARDEYNALVSEHNAGLASEAYESLDSASELIIAGMSDIYISWYFGIYEADDCLSVVTDYVLSEKLSLSFGDIWDAMQKLDMSCEDLQRGWEYCVKTVIKAYEMNGTYKKINNHLSDASEKIQALADTDEDDVYYTALKNYYSKVSSYAAFFEEPSGSFLQLSTTMTDYENDIRTSKEAVELLL